MDEVALTVAAGVAGYLIGTFPTADLVTRLATRGGVDIRAVGSGNPGGLNTMHSVGTAWGIVVILVDILKGAVAGLVGWAIGGTAGVYAGATAGIAGHIFPVWTRFRGGKGVATSAGAVLAVFPIFFPVDAAAAAIGALGLRNAERAIWVTCPLWIASAIVWWLADLPNLWGPEPTVGLAVFAVVSAVMILGKFAAALLGVIALVTDSNAQLPEELRARFGARVVPLTIVLDGEDHLEGVDLDPDEFYDRLAGGAQVSTAAPSPGRFAETYAEAAAAGASEILSIHIGSNTSATVNVARLAAQASPVPVEIVDTGTASFPIACCVWAAAAVIQRGAELEAAAAEARAVAAAIGNVFVVGALDLARRGGRLAPGVAAEGVPVLALDQGTMDVVGRAHDLEGAVDAMVAYFETFAAGRAMRVGVGDARAEQIADELERRLRSRAEVTELVRYAVGPSVGAHSGPGTVGAVFFPEELAR